MTEEFKTRKIEITFAEPVELPDQWFKHIVEVASALCYRYEQSHPGRVMWPFGIGFKPTYIPMTRQEELERGMEFDEDIMSIECYERVDYAWPCKLCGLEQGDHAPHIIDPLAGDCKFELADSKYPKRKRNQETSNEDPKDKAD